VTHLRKVMLEELQRRNFSSETIRGYIGAVERFSRYFGKPPDRLGPDHIRQWQAHLLHERKLAVGTVVNHVAGLRFFFRRVLKRRFPPDSIPYPKYSHHRTPRILSAEEVARLIDAAGNLQARTILMTLYSTGIRRSERSAYASRTSTANAWSSTFAKARVGKTAMCCSVPDSSKRSANTGDGRSPRRGYFQVNHENTAST
jgi:site-specific recombinase XerD